MDPNATLQRIQDALDGYPYWHDTLEADAACRDLYDWLQAQAFAPDWQRYPLATEYYREYVNRLGRS